MTTTFAEQYRTHLLDAVGRIDTGLVQQAIQWFEQALEEGKHIFVCGNGGSASTASHFVCDMVKGASYQRDRRFKIMALTDQVSTLTAYANDVNYSSVFVEQLRNFAQPGDLFLGLSGSGNSPNVIEAMKYANEAGCKTIALTGRDGGLLGPLAQLNIHVSVPHMGRIEDAHMIVCHMIAYRFMEAGSSEAR